MQARNQMETCTLDIKKTAMNRQISLTKSPSLGFTLFKHSFKAYGGSKFLNFTLRGVILISTKMSSMGHWVIKLFSVLPKGWL